MADVEVKVDISGNLTNPTALDTKQDFKMPLPVKLNLSIPVAQEWIGKRRENLKPWLQFAEYSKFQSPPSVPALGARIVKNVDDFQSNYLCIFIILILYCLLTSPLLLFAVSLSLVACGWLSKRNADQKVALLGHELSLAQQYSIVAIVSLPLFYLAGAGSVVFWVLGASMFFIVLHASFYHNDPTGELFEKPIQQV